MKKSRKYQTFFQFIALAIFYVVGMNIFLFLKLLGLSELSNATAEQRDSVIPASTIMALAIALSIGLLEIKLFPKWSGFSFRKFLIYKYALIIFVIVSGSTLIYFLSLAFSREFSAIAAFKTIPFFLHSQMFLSTFIYLLLFSVFLNIFKTLSEHLGPEAMVDALFGTYHHPGEDDRTFIFIDLQSSTALAEKMGHVQYSLFIQSCFQLLTVYIYEFNASLYQFVGDEAVLSWKTKAAKKTLAPVHLYYAFAGKLEAEQKIFLDQFGEVPHFKAAIHAGHVSVTKIRSTKMDIVYHGDVLNTCARIVAECSRLQKDLLVSSTIAGWLQKDSGYSATLVDSFLLRGKEVKTELYEINN